ncbi:hypothetical protein IAT40_003349 [Kwoniella sp. CBS 6097]
MTDNDNRDSASGPSTPSRESESTLRSRSRSRSNKPEPIQTHSYREREQDQGRENENESQGETSTPRTGRSRNTRHGDGAADQGGDGDERSDAGSNVNMKQVPGGLWLPAVKGTIGGIESPRRHVRSTPSISTLNPGTPTTANSRSHSQQTPNSASSQSPLLTQTQIQTYSQPQYEPPTGARAAVFRADPTVKSCFLGLKMDAKDEIARLFGVA